eukprot:350372-Chlamydomonas_euryale.AAC.10
MGNGAQREWGTEHRGNEGQATGRTPAPGPLTLAGPGRAFGAGGACDTGWAVGTGGACESGGPLAPVGRVNLVGIWRWWGV